MSQSRAGVPWSPTMCSQDTLCSLSQIKDCWLMLHVSQREVSQAVFPSVIILPHLPSQLFHLFQPLLQCLAFLFTSLFLSSLSRSLSVPLLSLSFSFYPSLFRSHFQSLFLSIPLSFYPSLFRSLSVPLSFTLPLSLSLSLLS